MTERLASMRQLLLDIDQEARTIARGLESNGKLPPGFCDKHYQLLPYEQRELRRLKTAMLLADGPDTYVALARENKMPRGWMERRLRELGISR